MKLIHKSDLKNIDQSLILQAFDASKNNQLIEKTPENRDRRNAVFLIKKYSRKYSIDIQNILTVEDFFSNIEEKSDDFYELGLIKELQEILKVTKTPTFDQLYSHILNLSGEQKTDIIQNYITALNNSAIVQVVDRDGIIQYVNEMYKNISGDFRTILGKNISYMGGRKYQDQLFWKDLWDTVLAGNIWTGVIQNPLLDKKGSYYSYTTITPIKDDNGEIIEFVAIKFDVTQMKTLESELSSTNSKLERIINTTSQGFWTIDKDLKLLDLNDSLTKMLGYPREELIGRDIRDFLDDENLEILERQSKLMESTENREYNLNFIKKDGGKVGVILKATSLFDENENFKEAIGFLTDISEIKNHQEELYRISVTDELTGIGNRRLFDTSGEKYLKLLEKKEIKSLSAAVLDIDFFKRVNDSFGHDIGDIVLKTFGERLKNISKKEIEVYRTGGEEFGVLGIDIEPEELFNILNSFREFNEKNPISIPNSHQKEIHFTISGGISSYTQADISPSMSFKNLYKKADILLYAAKKNGRNSILNTI